MSSHTPLNDSDVRTMLQSGTDPSDIIERLVETGAWSNSGATEIVRFMTRGPDALMNTNTPLPRPKRARDPRQARDPRGAGLRRGSWA